MMDRRGLLKAGIKAVTAAAVGDGLSRDIAGVQALGVQAIRIDRGSAESSGGIVPGVRIGDLGELSLAADGKEGRV